MVSTLLKSKCEETSFTCSQTSQDELLVLQEILKQWTFHFASFGLAPAGSTFLAPELVVWRAGAPLSVQLLLSRVVFQCYGE